MAVTAQELRQGQSAQRSPALTVDAMRSQRSVKNYFMWVLTGAAMVVGFVPFVGGAITAVIGIGTDLIKTRTESGKELKLRSKYYAEQIGATLGMDPRNVTVKDFAQAAKINPSLRKLYDEPLIKKGSEMKTSLLVNGGAAIAGAVIPGGHAASYGMKTLVEGVRGAGSMAYAAKTIAGGLAGGALGGALAKDKVESQEMLEALEQGIADADRQGIPRSQAINPQLIFILRVSQDALLEQQIKRQFGTALHKMKPEQIQGVMNAFPELAGAATREAHAIAKGIMPIRDIGATAPNLQGNFAGGMVERSNASHVDRLAAQRAAAAQQGITA